MQGLANSAVSLGLIEWCFSTLASSADTESPPRGAAFRSCRNPPGLQSSAPISGSDGTRARSSTSVVSPRAANSCPRRLSHNTGALRRAPYPRSPTTLFRRNVGVGVGVGMRVPRVRESLSKVYPGDCRIISRNPRAALRRASRVNAIQYGTADAFLIAEDVGERTRTFFHRIAVIAARARIHRGDEHKTRQQRGYSKHATAILILTYHAHSCTIALPFHCTLSPTLRTTEMPSCSPRSLLARSLVSTAHS